MGAKAGDKSPGSGRIPAEVVEERLQQTARTLVRVRSHMDAERMLSKEFGVNRRTVREWIRKVKARWRADADPQKANDVRAELTAQLDAVIASAWNHYVVTKDKDGNPVVDAVTGKPHLTHAPKQQVVLHAVAQLRALYGADKPAKLDVRVDGDVHVMPDLAVIPVAVQEQLRSALEKLAPGGDIRQLAGEWYRQEDPVEVKR